MITSSVHSGTKTTMDEFSCTTREAADALGICVRTAQLWVEQGRLRAWKTPGGHRRILRESVNAQLRAREKECGVTLEEFDVLIVEDERTQRQLLQTKVSGIVPKISVRTAYNGVEGLIKIGERQPNVLVTDLLMPGLDGFHLIKTLTSSPLLRPIQIIVITGLADAEISEQGGLPSEVITLHKPVPVPVLVSMIKAYHDIWARQRQTIA
jgi:excisionase family DNA binding protein